MVLAEFRRFRDKYMFNPVMATDGWLQMDDSHPETSSSPGTNPQQWKQ